MEDRPTVLKGVRWKAVSRVLGFVTLVAVGIALVIHSKGPTHVLMGIVAALFFTWVTFQNLSNALKPWRLTIDDQGFTLTAIGPPKRVQWMDVEQFRLLRYRGTSIVTWNYKSDRAPEGFGTSLNRHFGYDDALPAGWRLSPKRLVEVLERRRQAALTRPPAPAQSGTA